MGVVFVHLMSYSIVLLWHFHHLADAAVVSQECFRDADCSDTSFCDQSSTVCETCVPCQSLFNRATAADARNCAKTEDDCGLCLPGYQSEDLTGQRRSYKCYPLTADQQLEVPLISSYVISWNEFTSLSAAIVLLAAILVAFASYYMKGRNSVSIEPLDDGGIVGRITFKDNILPPPYSQVVSSVQTYSFATLKEDCLNEATPVGRYHMSSEDPRIRLDPNDFDLDREMRSEEESAAGSTETIPSMWEPTTDNTPVSNQHNPSRLVRSQSLTTLNLLGDLRSRSCPNLSNSVRGIHCHRHVLLSNYRRPTIPTNQPSVKMEEGRYVELNELLAPHSFPSIEETEQPREISVNRGRVLLRSLSAPEDNTESRDTGFLDPSTSLMLSRRRPVNEEFSFTMAVGNKRRRKD